MGFYSLWRWFSPWTKRKYPYMIYWYSDYVLKTPEQREEDRKREQEKLYTALFALNYMAVFTDSHFLHTV